MSTFEMIGWHLTAPGRHGCVALYENEHIRALAQIREDTCTHESALHRRYESRYLVRAIATDATECDAGSDLLLRLLREGVLIDWDSLTSRWYVAACYHITESVF